MGCGKPSGFPHPKRMGDRQGVTPVTCWSPILFFFASFFFVDNAAIYKYNDGVSIDIFWVLSGLRISSELGRIFLPFSIDNYTHWDIIK